jgi:6-phosphofructokinase 1
MPLAAGNFSARDRLTLMQRIAILTSGGDAPGMNAAVRAATRAACARGWEVYGVRNGFAGLLADTIEPLRARDVGGIMQRGGTVLGSARAGEFRTEAGRAKGLHNLRRRDIEALVVIGGNGSQTGSCYLSEAGFPVVGVASTVDNDLFGTDVTIGVDTAVNITLEAIDRLRTTGSSHQRAFLVETMGRNCGYIALMAGLAGGAEVIVVPECEVSPAEVADRLREAYRRGKTHAMVVVAEGTRHSAEAMMKHFAEHRDSIGFGLRMTTLGHVVRGGAPTAADRILATRLGAAAVDRLAAGAAGVLMGMVGGEIITTPLPEIAGKTKPIDCRLLELARMLAQ